MFQATNTVIPKSGCLLRVIAVQACEQSDERDAISTVFSGTLFTSEEMLSKLRHGIVSCHTSHCGGCARGRNTTTPLA